MKRSLLLTLSLLCLFAACHQPTKREMMCHDWRVSVVNGKQLTEAERTTVFHFGADTIYWIETPQGTYSGKWYLSPDEKRITLLSKDQNQDVILDRLDENELVIKDVYSENTTVMLRE